MDIETMHQNVKVELDKSSALELPAFETEEIDYWINKAIREFVKTRYDGLNIHSTGFEQTQKRIDDLRTLVEYDVLSAGSGVDGLGHGRYGDTTWSFDLPADYWFTLAEEVRLDVDGDNYRVGVVQCTHDEYIQKFEDPFSEHILHYGTAKPLRLFYNDSVEFVTDGNYDVDRYYLTYLKVPETVEYGAGTDCDLPEHTHDEIVNMAANMMLENIEQPRYQTHSAEVATME